MTVPATRNVAAPNEKAPHPGRGEAPEHRDPQEVEVPATTVPPAHRAADKVLELLALSEDPLTAREITDLLRAEGYCWPLSPQLRDRYKYACDERVDTTLRGLEAHGRVHRTVEKVNGAFLWCPAGRTCVCPDCHGDGEREFNPSRHGDPWAVDSEPCSTCHRQGSLEVRA